MTPRLPRTPAALDDVRRRARGLAEAAGLVPVHERTDLVVDSVSVGPDTLHVRGSVRSTLGAVRSVTVEVGPVSVLATGTGVGHEDLTHWEAHLPRPVVGVGRHAVVVTAVFDGGRDHRLSHGDVVLESARLWGALDSPTTGDDVVAGVLHVTGWTRATSGVHHVDVLVEGTTPVRARLMTSVRPDIAEVVPDRDAYMSGWEATVDVDGRRGPTRVTARASTADGDVDLGTSVVRVVDPGRPLDDGDAARTRVLVERSRRAVERGSRRAWSPNGRLRVLVAAHHLGTGGAQLYLDELLRVLTEEHDDVEFVVWSPVDGILRGTTEARGTEVQVTGHPPISAPEYEQWARWALAEVDSLGVDAVLANTAGTWWAVDLAGRLGLPSVWTIHESYGRAGLLDVTFPARPDDHVVALFDEAFAKASAVVFEAPSTRELYLDRVPEDRALVVEYGIDLGPVPGPSEDRRAAARRRTGHAPDDVVLVSIGTVEPRKGQALVVAAFDAVAGEHPRARLALVGDAPGAYSAGLHELVARADHGDRVDLVPSTPDLADWYAAADAFVLASDVESLPRTMIEASAHGLPVVATRVFGVPDLVEDGVTGVLFEPSSVEAAGAALDRFLGMSDDVRRAMGRRARDIATTTRSSSGYATAVHALLAELVGAAREAQPQRRE